VGPFLQTTQGAFVVDYKVQKKHGK
jgi:hypothetical protein